MYDMKEEVKLSKNQFNKGGMGREGESNVGTYNQSALYTSMEISYESQYSQWIHVNSKEKEFKGGNVLLRNRSMLP